ncbi:glutathione S-transferase [Apiospora rasikravindrae]|uniref:Glutathione S-transferase n=1 Tax=Apiospora rasikravindrae TaxID=990691 RepID=A0ABR1RQJ8_9PEZI
MVLTVHHLQVSQSERIPWLCEELGIAYELKNYQRAPALAPPEFKALHWTGSAPVITDDDGQGGVLTLAESGACVQYICEKHGGGRLFPSASHPRYADFLYWFHWTNGTFTPTIGRAGMVPDDKDDGSNPMVAFFKQKRDEGYRGARRARARPRLAGGGRVHRRRRHARVLVDHVPLLRARRPDAVPQHPRVLAARGRARGVPARHEEVRSGDEVGLGRGGARSRFSSGWRGRTRVLCSSTLLTN